LSQEECGMDASDESCWGSRSGVLLNVCIPRLLGREDWSLWAVGLVADLLEIWSNQSLYTFVNEMQALCLMVRVVNVSMIQAVYVWRPVCAYRLRLARSLEEKRSEDCDLVSGPQKLEFLEGLSSCQGVSEKYAPCLFGYNIIRVQMDYHWNLLMRVLMKVKVRAISLTFHFWTYTHFVPCDGIHEFSNATFL
jgi:hypothetical protein